MKLLLIIKMKIKLTIMFQILNGVQLNITLITMVQLIEEQSLENVQ